MHHDDKILGPMSQTYNLRWLYVDKTLDLSSNASNDEKVTTKAKIKLMKNHENYPFEIAPFLEKNVCHDPKRAASGTHTYPPIWANQPI